MLVPRSPVARRLPASIPADIGVFSGAPETPPGPLPSETARSIHGAPDMEGVPPQDSGDVSLLRIGFDGPHGVAHSGPSASNGSVCPNCSSPQKISIEQDDQSTSTPRTVTLDGAKIAPAGQSALPKDPTPPRCSTAQDPGAADSRPYKSIPSTPATLALLTECQQLQQLASDFGHKCRNEIIPSFQRRMSSACLNVKNVNRELIESKRHLAGLVATLGKNRESSRDDLLVGGNKELLQHIKKQKALIQEASETLKLEAEAFRLLKEEEKLFRSNSGLAPDGKLELYKGLCRVEWLQWQENKDGKVLANICFEDDVDENGAPQPTKIVLASQPRYSCPRIVENVDWAWNRAEEILNQRLRRTRRALLRRRSGRSQQSCNSSGSSCTIKNAQGGSES